MARVSKRGNEMPASPIRRLVPFANEAKSRGVHVHHLNIGQPDIKTPRAMIEAYQKYDAEVLAYGPSQGLPELREAIAKYYEGCGVPITAENVTVTFGGSEAVQFALGAIADPDDEVLVFEPFYANYLGFAVQAGIRLVPVTTTADDGFHLPSDETIEAALTERTRGIVFCSPGNPTGTIYSKEEMERLGRLAEKHDLVLISDEVYREFAYDGVVVTSALSLPCASERVIVVDSVSKRYSACGARVGCVITTNDELGDVFMRMSFARLCPATVDQLAAVAGYATPKSYFEEVVIEYQRRRDALVDGLNALDGVQTYKPEGAFYSIVTFDVDDADDFSQWLLTGFSHGGETVMMAPASGFYCNQALGRRQARIAYVLNVDALESSIDALSVALQMYPSRSERPK